MTHPRKPQPAGLALTLLTVAALVAAALVFGPQVLTAMLRGGQ
jgi:hypothetical protein